MLANAFILFNFVSLKKSSAEVYWIFIHVYNYGCRHLLNLLSNVHGPALTDPGPIWQTVHVKQSIETATNEAYIYISMITIPLCSFLNDG